LADLKHAAVLWVNGKNKQSESDATQYDASGKIKAILFHTIFTTPHFLHEFS